MADSVAERDLTRVVCVSIVDVLSVKLKVAAKEFLCAAMLWPVPFRCKLCCFFQTLFVVFSIF